jgi:hypothetical protein
MCASRRSSRTWAGPRPGGVTARTAAIASVTAANGVAPGEWSSRDSMTSSHQRSGSSYPAAAASTAIGSVRTRSTGSAGGSAGARSPAALSAGAGRRRRDDGPSTLAAGRSQNRRGTSCSPAHTSACHSGENSASGQNAATSGDSCAYASSATGGAMPSATASAAIGSASAGPSTRTASGRSRSSSARTARADPGP